LRPVDIVKRLAQAEEVEQMKDVAPATNRLGIPGHNSHLRAQGYTRYTSAFFASDVCDAGSKPTAGTPVRTLG